MLRQTLIKLILCSMLFLQSTIANANNIMVSNVVRTGMTVSFTLQWDNAFRVNTKGDAAWIFIKYRNPICDPTTWIDFNHGQLSTNMALHTFSNATVEAAMNVTAAPNNTGIMIRPTTTGVPFNGNIGPVTVTLTLLAPFPAVGNLEIRVFAIEMAKVPQGSYSIGDGSVGAGSLSSKNHFYTGTNPATPFVVTGAAITVGGGAGQLNAAGSLPPSNIPVTYPMGVNTFWVMKAEITQQQYVDFLNTLALSQAYVRLTPGAIGTYTIAGNWPYYNSGGIPDRACGVLSFKDVAAYLDWAALRPMTEFEFEKICRGDLPPVPNEYAWGNTNLTLVSTRTFVGTNCESVANINTPAVANYAQLSIFGTLRPGFLCTATSTRLLSSAGEYGHFNMSDNLYEPVINAASTAGLAYTATWGNGYLNANGDADAATWPIATQGSGYRGGAWYGLEPYLRVSARDLIILDPNIRYDNTGGRGCR